MQKDFLAWHLVKARIHDRAGRSFYHEREVWWCSLGLNIGFEIDGKGEDYARPIVVLKGFNKESFLCIPLTTKSKEGKYYYPIDLGDGIVRAAVLSQIRIMDAKRLQEKIGIVRMSEFVEIKKQFPLSLRNCLSIILPSKARGKAEAICIFIIVSRFFSSSLWGFANNHTITKSPQSSI